MKRFVFEQEQFLHASIDTIFEFFSDARNLERITPPWLSFNVVTPQPIELKVGTRIDYKLRVRGVPIRWQSEITAWEPPIYFVDEQRKGPYRIWIHEHRFEERPGGVLAIDSVEYAVPGGALVHALFVKRDVERIFQFCKEILEEIFAQGEPENPSLSHNGSTHTAKI